MRRVEINDGEGVVYQDINDIGKLMDRNFARRLFGPRDVAGWGSSLLLVAGSDFALSGTENRTMTLTKGYYAKAFTPVTDDDPTVDFGEVESAVYTFDARTSGAVFRRDIIEARLEAETTEVPTARDFKDAVTDVVTSELVNKRRVRRLTLQVKKGTDQTTEDLANANEPTPTAGFTKIYSILIPDSGSCASSKVFDWHNPVGYIPLTTLAPMISAAGSGSDAVLTNIQAFGSRWVFGSVVTDSLCAHCPQHHFTMARLQQVGYCGIARNAGSALEVTLNTPQTTTGAGVIEDFTASVSISTSVTIQLFTPTFPIWHGHGTNRNVTTPNAGPLFLYWKDQGDGTDGQLINVQWVWAGY